MAATNCLKIFVYSQEPASQPASTTRRYMPEAHVSHSDTPHNRGATHGPIFLLIPAHPAVCSVSKRARECQRVSPIRALSHHFHIRTFGTLCSVALSHHVPRAQNGINLLIMNEGGYYESMAYPSFVFIFHTHIVVVPMAM